MSYINLDAESFAAEVENGQGVALVDFWAPWCGPCKMLGPIIEELADELDGSVLVGKINVDEEMELAQRFGVMSIPTIIIFQDGIEINRMVGFKTKQQILSVLSIDE